MLFSYAVMAATKGCSAGIGRVTGKGIAANLREHYPLSLLRAIVGLLLVANIINLGADLGAMGDALRLIIGGSTGVYVVAFAILCAWLEIFLSYGRYVRVLKWLTLSLFAYVATVLVVEVPWHEVLYRTLVPGWVWQQDYVIVIVAVLGTTISPYLFFWQASEEAEDERVNPAEHPLTEAPGEARGQIRRIEIDTYVGMGLSNLIALCIIVTTAATLHRHGVTDIQTSEQAAEALRPIAGEFAFAVVTSGIVGTGLLAIPVLAGSAAYALAQAMGWSYGPGPRPRQAQAVYGPILLRPLFPVGINFIQIDPIKALFWTAVINGVVAVPLMIVMMLMTTQPRVMGQFTLPRLLWIVGWISTAAMTIAVATMFATWQG